MFVVVFRAVFRPSKKKVRYISFSVERVKREYDAFAGEYSRLKDYPGRRRFLKDDYTSVIGNDSEVQ